MSATAIASTVQQEPELLGQTVVVIGGSAGIGFETARRARAEGAKVILTARNPERLKQAAIEIDAMSTSAFDATDPVAIENFFHDLPTIDHVMVTAGRPYYGRLADMDFAKIRDLIGEHLLQALYVARNAANKVRPGGTLIFMGGTGGRRPAIGMSIAELLKRRWPVHLVNHLAALCDLHRAGRFDRTSDDVLTLTGQVPLSMQEFVRKNAAAFTAEEQGKEARVFADAPI
jgi:NAD(P)-dependent dehydrogenase (short-subunit alcohol dehydrogenase family)